MSSSRWAIQLVVVAFWIAVIVMSRIVYQRKFEWRYCLRNLMPWFVHIVVFFAASLIRMAVMGASVPLSPLFAWWLGVLMIHGGLALLGIFHYILKNGY